MKRSVETAPFAPALLMSTEAKEASRKCAAHSAYAVNAENVESVVIFELALEQDRE